MWGQIQQLEGKTLKTVRGLPFIVKKASPSGISVAPVSTGLARTISRSEIERAAALGIRAGDLTPSMIRAAGASEYNPAYVVAILKAVAAGG